MRGVFIGTVEFSLRSLEKLISLKVNLIGVVTKESSSFNSDFVDLKPLCISNDIPCLNQREILFDTDKIAMIYFVKAFTSLKEVF